MESRIRLLLRPYLSLCIAVSKNMGDAQSLAQMVQEVNAGEVSMEEQLSDHVYSYNEKTQTLSLADTSVEQLEMVKVSENEQAYETANQDISRVRHHR